MDLYTLQAHMRAVHVQENPVQLGTNLSPYEYISQLLTFRHPVGYSEHSLHNTIFEISEIFAIERQPATYQYI